MSWSTCRAASAAALSLCIATVASANKAPSIKLITAKGPGVATITFDHDDLFGLESYAAQRLVAGAWQDVAMLAQAAPGTPRARDAADRLVTVTFLEPNTEHALRLCAIYRAERLCSGERNVRTPPLPAAVGSGKPMPAIIGHESSESGLRVHFRAATSYDFYLLRWKRVDRGVEQQIRSPGGGMSGAVDITGLRDGTEHQVVIQGCHRNGKASACSAPSVPYRATTAFTPPQPPQLDLARYPNGDRLDTGPTQIALVFVGDADFRTTNVTLKRDGVLVHDARAEGRMANPLTDKVPHPNRLYRYEVCFVRGESACSPVFEARPPPVAPTAPADARVSISRKWRGLKKGKPTLEAAWRNSEIPGAFVTVERGEGIADAAGFRWKEVGRIDTRDDPTSLSVEVPAVRGQDRQAASAYRVCSVVPELGEKGRACTEAVTP
jgi:hypothetical protein